MGKNITYLNSLRFIAFLIIFVCHSMPQHFPYAYIGVDFLFTFSGFLFTFLALDELKRTGSFNRRNFFIRRSLRIWPLYFLFLSFFFYVLPTIVSYSGNSITLPQKKYFFWFFISNYDYSQYHFALKQLWTISVGEQLYILFLLVAPKLKMHFWKVISGFIFIFILCLLDSYFNHNIHLRTNTFYHLISFTMGMIGANIAVIKKEKSCMQFFLFISVLLSFVLIYYPQLPFHDAILKILISIFSSALLMWIVQNQSLFKKVISLLWIPEKLGKYSYGLYIYSGVFIPLGLKLIHSSCIYLPLIVQLIVTILTAIASYHFFEKNIIRLKEKFRN